MWPVIVAEVPESAIVPAVQVRVIAPVAQA
jgi:hypothetical protein